MPQTLTEKLTSGAVMHTAWAALGSPIVAEMLVRCGYQAVTIDMQHGQYGYAEARDAIAGIIMAGGHAIVRTPLDDYSVAARLLDCGAEAIIAPMINTLDDARAFVGATKLPPVGGRSYGPNRAAQLTGNPIGQAFLENANSRTMAIAMIETQEAIDNLDGILALDGIDGIFIGPSDLSISLTKGARLDPMGEETMRIAAMAAQGASAAGKIASAYASTPAHAADLEAAGFTLIANGSDFGVLSAGARAILPG